MKGHVIIILPVETAEAYHEAHETAFLPWELEEELAHYIDAKIGSTSDSGHFLFGGCEVWTLSAFAENGGSLTADHQPIEGQF